ncbi:MAG: PsbP-related protein [Candidatus Nitrosopolaris sp.]
MYNKILPTVLIMILVGSLSSIATSSMLYYVLPQEAIAHVDKMFTYENSTYGIRMQYPSNWQKEENVSSGSDNKSMLVDVVKFISPTKNASDSSSESLDIKIDKISDIQPITLAKYANNSIEDLRKDFDIIKLDRNASLSNNPAYKLVYTGVEEGVNLQAMLILTIKGDKAYIISYNAEPTKFSYYLPTLEKMLNSFQITK